MMRDAPETLFPAGSWLFCFSPWAKHDGHELAKIMADGVDLVTVAATYLDLRADFEKRRVRLPGAGARRNQTITPAHTPARFLRADMA